MTKAPDWTEAEFQTLLDSSNISAADLAGRLSGRTPDAIEVVRQGIHRYHSGMDTSMLSQMMLRVLSQRGGSLVCPVCQTAF